ncbi:MAG TPA: metallophosphoesterase [Polyangia bacterium]|nr:metallophosphoesterase [Polyangia bacterium]
MRIAHFSDVHALDLSGARPWAFLNKRFAGWVNLKINRRGKHPTELFEAVVDDLNARPPDEVIVTGDLTNLSLPSEFTLARSILDRLRLGPEHVTVVPGNHDVYTLSALARGSFARHFARYTAGDEGAGFPAVRVRGDVAIVGVSTARPSPVPFADGRVGAAQLAAIESALARLDGKFRILALHHPPVDNRHAFLRGLRDRSALQRVLARVGAELILHGHEHRDLRTEVAGPRGPIPVIGVGSATYSDPRPERRARYNVYTIEHNALVSIETRVHDARTNQFLS